MISLLVHSFILNYSNWSVGMKFHITLSLRSPQKVIMNNVILYLFSQQPKLLSSHVHVELPEKTVYLFVCASWTSEKSLKIRILTLIRTF